MGILQHRYALLAAAAVAVIGWGALLVAPTGASAAIVTLDSTVHGTARDLGTQDGTADQTFDTFVEILDFGNSSTQDRGVIEFDISSLTTPITSAILKLTRTSLALPGIRTLEVSGYTGNGTLELADYSPAGASVIGTFEHFDEATEEFDVTAFINAQIALNDADHFAGLMIRWASDPEIDVFAVFGQTNPANSFPDLQVSAVPLPAALPLFASALAGLGFFGWRRRKQGAVA